jgi:hypothetical protein
LKNRHTGNDRENMEIREYGGTISIALHEPPTSDRGKGIEWVGYFDVDAPQERMYWNGRWTKEIPLPFQVRVAKVRGQWETRGFPKVTCDEVQRLLANPASTGTASRITAPTGNPTAKDDIRHVDFLNFAYRPTLCHSEYAKEGIGKVMQIRNGKFANGKIDYGVVDNKVIYGELTGDNGQEAVVHTNCWLRGANFGLSEIQIFTLQDGQPLLLANINDNDRQRDYRRYYPGGNLWFGLTGVGSAVKIIGGNLIIEQLADGPHCCPESIVALTYHWNGKQFVLSKPPQKKPFTN